MITAISLLKCYCEMESVPECDKSEFRRAIRVLEAAGKVDKKQALAALKELRSMASAFMGGPDFGDKGIIGRIRALLEALPEKGE